MEQGRLSEVCVNDKHLRKYVRILANRVHYKVERNLEAEDVENDIWLAVFSKLETRYSGDVDVITFARRIAYSTYGHYVEMVNKKTKRTRKIDITRTDFLDTVDEYIPSRGVHHEDIIDARDLIESIEVALKKRYSSGKRYRIPVEQMRHILGGGTVHSYIKDSKTPRSSGLRAFSRITVCAQEVLKGVGSL